MRGVAVWVCRAAGYLIYALPTPTLARLSHTYQTVGKVEHAEPDPDPNPDPHPYPNPNRGIPDRREG